MWCETKSGEGCLKTTCCKKGGLRCGERSRGTIPSEGQRFRRMPAWRLRGGDGVGEEAQRREDGRDGWMLKEIGEQWGVSKERVRQVRNDALGVLCLPLYSVRLRQLCGQESRGAYVPSRELSA